ncbi:MAG: hypothetical protein FWH27_03120, partial [Planctomycetaceae bacterium]|nr:hypothetical protein [Planctomycetaceae bacterium]
LKAVTTQAGYPDAMAQAEMMLSQLQGIDTKQPIGIVIQADDESFGGYGFLPIPDISVSPLAGFLQFGEKQADGSVMISLAQMNPMMPPIYIKQSGKWAFVSVAELPKTLPTDPVKLLEGMEKEYLLGIKANIANLPKDLCLGVLNMIRMTVEMQAQTEADAEAVSAVFDQFETLLEELKTFSYCIAVTLQNDIVVDTTVEAVAGSVLAADLASAASMKTNQIGFFQSQDSIAALVGAGVLNAIVKQQYTSQLTKFFEGAHEGIEDGDLDADGIAAAKSVLDNVEAMLLSTIDAGKIDIGATWRKNGTLLVGAAITDGNKLQQALEKSLVAVPEEFRQFVKFNTEQYEGFAVSTIAVPTTILPQEGMSSDLASRTMTLHIAIKDTGIALAFGLDDTVLADLKKAITASKIPANIPPTTFVFTPGNLVDFFTLIGPSGDNEGYEQAMDMVRSFPPDAQITGTNSYSGNTQKSKVVVSGKLLPGIGKFIGVSIEAAQKARQIIQERNSGDFEIDQFDF